MKYAIVPIANCAVPRICFRGLKQQTLPVAGKAGIVRLLIVEENGAMRRLVRAVLEGLRISISECSDGTQVLAACAGT